MMQLAKYRSFMVCIITQLLLLLLVVVVVVVVAVVVVEVEVAVSVTMTLKRIITRVFYSILIDT